MVLVWAESWLHSWNCRFAPSLARLPACLPPNWLLDWPATCPPCLLLRPADLLQLPHQQHALLAQGPAVGAATVQRLRVRARARSSDSLILCRRETVALPCCPLVLVPDSAPPPPLCVCVCVCVCARAAGCMRPRTITPGQSSCGGRARRRPTEPCPRSRRRSSNSSSSRY